MNSSSRGAGAGLQAGLRIPHLLPCSASPPSSPWKSDGLGLPPEHGGLPLACRPPFRPRGGQGQERPLGAGVGEKQRVCTDITLLGVFPQMQHNKPINKRFVLWA